MILSKSLRGVFASIAPLFRGRRRPPSSPNRDPALAEWRISSLSLRQQAQGSEFRLQAFGARTA